MCIYSTKMILRQRTVKRQRVTVTKLDFLPTPTSGDVSSFY